MSLLEVLAIGLEGLTLHKMRSLLTMLGIIFGVAAVVAMMAIGNGAKEETRRQIEAYGADTVYIRARHIRGDALREARASGVYGLTPQDAEVIAQIASFVTEVAPQALVDVRCRREDRTPQAQVVGTTATYFSLTHARFETGRAFSDDDEIRFNRVAVLGHRVARDLFQNTEPVGALLSIGGFPFKVIGVLAPTSSGTGDSKGGAQIRTRDTARDVYIPISVGLGAFQKLKQDGDSQQDVRYHRVSEIILKLQSTDQLKAAKPILEAILTRRHAKTPDFEVIIPLEILEQSRKAQEIFNLVMALIAGLSLLVGGIGIMNIMVANVSERTREIGIRRAVGATQRDIQRQFLWEAILISLVGGLVGIVLGMSISWTVSYVLGWETLTTLFSILLSFGVASTIGVTFGAYPARLASRLDPIEALRHQ